MRDHATLILALVACLLCTFGASAQAPVDVREGIASNGLCGLAREAYPTCPERWALAAHAGYGYTESLGTVSGAHHRALGSIGGGMVPLPWLALALRFDGRLDLHPDDQRGKDTTGTGDPRLFVRAGRDLKRGASLGGEVVVWAPGNTAPSFDPKAITADFKALAAWRPNSAGAPGERAPRRNRFALLGHVGYRLDRSANTAPDLRRLRQGDRIALGLSDYDAVLVGLGVSLRTSAKSELFAEVSLDALVGSGAPSLKESPLHAALGARYLMASGLQGELALSGVFSSRPSIAADAPLVPIDPRLSMALGVRYGRLLHPPPEAPDAGLEQPPEQPQPEQVMTADVHGRIIDDRGEPVPDVRVVLTVAPDTTLRETITDGEGGYAFSGVPVGDATVEASAPGLKTQQWLIEVRSDMPASEDRTLVRKSDTGSLRLLTRTFSSEPLSASISVRDARGRNRGTGKGDERGLYEIDLPPGRYTVMISAPGYRTLRREVQIERYGVAILNVDMREEK